MQFRHFRGKRPPRFAHESERELAELLDAEGIPWEYEPRSFPLRVAPDGRLLEAVRPDFYLPDADMYIECTEMKPSLSGRKRRKLRKLRTLYGEVVTLVDRGDFVRLRAKYGQARRRKAQGRSSPGNGAAPTLRTRKRPSASSRTTSEPGSGGGPSRPTNR